MIGSGRPVTEDAATRWRDALAGWGIPDAILAQAPEDPWTLPPQLFATLDRPESPSHRIARAALRPGDTVLDVGAGRCAMSLPLRPPAARIIAVDAQPSMLEDSPADDCVLGRWPDVAGEAGRADVVVCGHVVYNVADLVPFALALGAAARRRVVVEMTQHHPRAAEHTRVMWRHFWGAERPSGPTSDDAVEVLHEAGITPTVELWEGDAGGGFDSRDALVAWLRRTLCLPASRDAEVWEMASPFAAKRDGRWTAAAQPRAMATLWWEP
jgi:methyltransferase family protein